MVKTELQRELLIFGAMIDAPSVPCAKDFIGTPYCGQIKDQRYARSFLEPIVLRDEFFCGGDEKFKTAFVLRSRNSTVMMPGMSKQLRAASCPQTHCLRTAPCDFIAVGD